MFVGLAMNEREIRLVDGPEVRHRGPADLPVIFGLIEEGQALGRQYPRMAGIAEGPGAVPQGDDAEEDGAGLEDAPEIRPLREEEAPIPLPADMLEDVIGVDFVEAVVAEGKRNIVQVPDMIRLVAGLQVEGYEASPFLSATGAEVFGAGGAAADEEFAFACCFCHSSQFPSQVFHPVWPSVMSATM